MKKNPGAFLIHHDFINSDHIDIIAKKIDQIGWGELTQPKGLYYTDKWRVIKLITKGKETPLLAQFPEIKKMLRFFKCNVIELVFYSLLPGGQLHKHRDLSGTLELGRLRFHIPLVTYPSITFHAAGEDFNMKKGELWAINTSYLHAVNNPTQDIDRIHIMMEVEVNDWVWSLLPKKSFQYYFHSLLFFIFVGYTALKTVIEPHKLWGRLTLLRFIFEKYKKNKS